mgnify:CR=1 FL=1
MSPPPAAVAADTAAFSPSSPLPAAAALARPDSPFRAILMILASSGLFAAGDIAAKLMTDAMPGIEVAWLRYAVFCALILPPVFAWRGRRALKVPRPSLQVARGIAVAGSSVLFIVGLEYLDVAEATAINFVSPIFITALSIPLLGERVGLRRWAAALVGFLGVLIVVQPGGEAFSLAAFLPMGAAACWAVGAVTTRMMQADHPEVTLAWSSIVGLAVTTVLVVPEWTTPSLELLGVAVVMGAFSAGGHWLVIRAFRTAAASTLAPFSYVQILYAGLLSFVFLGAVPALWTFVGGAVIALSGLYTAHRERLARRAAR